MAGIYPLQATKFTSEFIWWGRCCSYFKVLVGHMHNEQRSQPRDGSTKDVQICYWSDYHRPSSVTSMLQQIQWPTLQQRRVANKVIMMFRIVNNQVAIQTTWLVPTAVLVKGHDHRFFVPFART